MPWDVNNWPSSDWFALSSRSFAPSAEHSIRMKIKLQLGAESEDGNLIRGQKAGEENGERT